ncbi:MAG: hypothetical protein P8186_02925 [Anaerolineae bacterium]|jgi:hypothetical protein
MRLYKSLWTLLLVLSAGCTTQIGTPDWNTLYAQKLGQPIVALHTASLNQSFQDLEGNLTRISWAQLADGTTVLLGLPAFQNPPQVVVDRTVVLTQARWQQACGDAIGKDFAAWGWNMTDTAVTNRLDIHVSTKASQSGQSIQLPDPTEPTCQFVFLPNGWELRIIYDKGPVIP